MGKHNVFDYRRLVGRLAGAAVICGALAAGMGYAGSANAADKKFTIYVSNNYIGNPWRAQMGERRPSARQPA